MDRIGKALKKLSAKERVSVKHVLLLISAGNFKGLHIKKLRSRKDIFRARKGKIRIIYRVGRGGDVFILAIERRTEKTYRMF
jgi:mRNA-degrading endonuclease RelE of RelBE toxin-antitoxin system